MRIIDTEDLKEKSVINLCDGKILGCAVDVSFSTEDGKICAIIVPLDKGLFNFGGEKIIIPWDKIECFGEDAILVRISLSECKRCEKDKREKKRRFFS